MALAIGVAAGCSGASCSRHDHRAAAGHPGEAAPAPPPRADAAPPPPRADAAPPPSAASLPSPAPRPDDLVNIASIDPRIQIDMRYATARNFTHVAFYPLARCLLRRAVAERLRRVEDALAARGLGLEVWDCYRPFSAQQRLWKLMPDPRYVARPVAAPDGTPRSGSKHNRGAAVEHHPGQRVRPRARDAHRPRRLQRSRTPTQPRRQPRRAQALGRARAGHGGPGLHPAGHRVVALRCAGLEALSAVQPAARPGRRPGRPVTVTTA